MGEGGRWCVSFAPGFSGKAEVNRLIAVLIERMNLPRHSPDGQAMSYKFHHKASGKQLLDTDTLVSANVKEGDILRLQPEITAGRQSSPVDIVLPVALPDVQGGRVE